MCPYDYTEAPPPRDTMELIPRDTIATLVLHIRSGGVGEDGMLTRTSKGDAEMLVCEFTLADGAYKGRKVFENLLLEATTDGHAEAAKISRSNCGPFSTVRSGSSPTTSRRRRVPLARSA